MSNPQVEYTTGITSIEAGACLRMQRNTHGVRAIKPISSGCGPETCVSCLPCSIMFIRYGYKIQYLSLSLVKDQEIGLLVHDPDGFEPERPAVRTVSSWTVQHFCSLCWY